MVKLDASGIAVVLLSCCIALVGVIGQNLEDEVEMGARSLEEVEQRVARVEESSMDKTEAMVRLTSIEETLKALVWRLNQQSD